MLIPLGLGIKLKNTPFVTYLIILICALVYFVGPSMDKVTKKEYTKILIERYSGVIVEDLLYEFCINEGHPNSRCCTGLKKSKYKCSDEKTDASEEAELDLGTVLKEAKGSYKFVTMGIKFIDTLKNNPSELSHLTSYSKFESAEDLAAEKIENIHKDNNLLSKRNINLLSLLQAIFTHGGLMHILGNMFFLFVFGRYVEARVGHFSYAILYLFLGALAIGLYAATTDESNMSYVLGASANVSVIMGMFYVLFIKFKMRFYVWYFIGRNIRLPINIFFPILYILQEFVFSMNSTSNVAHKAHLFGLVFGALAGLAIVYKQKLSEHFLYVEEERDWKIVKEIPELDPFLKKSRVLLEFNPYNNEIKDAMIGRLLDESNEERKYQDKAYRIYLRMILPKYMANLINTDQIEKVFPLLRDLSSEPSLTPYFSETNQKEILRMIDLSMDMESYHISVKLIQVYFEKYPRSRKIKSLGQTLNSILNFIKSKPNSNELIQSLFNNTSSKRLRRICIPYINEETIDA